MEKNKKIKGVGLIGIIIAVAVIALLGGGGLYFYKTNNKQPTTDNKTLIETGLDTKKRAEELKNKIEEQNKSAVDEINISNWITYRDHQNRFEIKYPNNWYIFNTQDTGMPIISSSNSLILSSVTKEKYFSCSGSPCLGGLAVRLNFGIIRGCDSSDRNYTIDMGNGLQFHQRVICLKHYSITLDSVSDILKKIIPNEAILEKIITSFQDFSDDSNLLSYRNEKYGFELKYPYDWIYNEDEKTNSIIVEFDPERDLDHTFIAKEILMSTPEVRIDIRKPVVQVLKIPERGFYIGEFFIDNECTYSIVNSLNSKKCNQTKSDGYNKFIFFQPHSGLLSEVFFSSNLEAKALIFTIKFVK